MSKCYSCKFRGTVPGSAHSSCNLVKEMAKDSAIDSGQVAALEIAFLTGKAKIKTEDDEEAIKLNPHGVKNGWANWPLDFDPIWVESCVMYTEK